VIALLDVVRQLLADVLRFAIVALGTWNALTLDTKNKRFVLNVEKDRLKDAPGFDKDHWPNMSDQSWARELHSYYGVKPYSDDPPAPSAR
jgi:hypothetical protein